MSAEMDIVIRGGCVVDGTGREGIHADLAIKDGRIAGIGEFSAAGRQEIDAGGMIVTPGFVDIHTHYDGQATWENRLAPSSLHGVTTVVMGNCGVGFAPCHAEEHQSLIRLMAGVEDIPEVVMEEGVPWSWESYPDYLDFLAGRKFDVDLCGYVPHAALRLYVMGERACRLEPASAEDRRRMAALLKDAIRAGALGVGTSQTINHKSSDGLAIPTFKAAEEELMALALAMQEVGRGVFQYVADWDHPEQIPEQFRMLERLVERSGRPLTFTVVQLHEQPDHWLKLLELSAAAQAKGLPITAQFHPRPIGILLGHELSLNPFSSTRSYHALKQLGFEALVAELKKPETRERILGEKMNPDPTQLIGRTVQNFDEIYPLGDPPNYEPLPETSIAGLAAAGGLAPAALAYDLMLERDGRAMLYMARANYAGGNLDVCRTAIRHDGCVVALGDGGAHLGLICDASYPTFMLTHWVRDRRRGERLTLPFVVAALSRRTAEVVGLDDRGVLAPGYRADVNIIDFDGLQLGSPFVMHDLPTGGRRLMQHAEGYVATIVNGVVTYRSGQKTGALPGRLVRGQQRAPAPAGC